MKRGWTLFLSKWVLLCALAGGLPAQDLGNDTLNRWVAWHKMNRQTDPAFPGVVIAQVEPTRSLNVGISQVRVLCDTGWYGPLWENYNYGYNSLRPLFEYNSDVYADSIFTEPIVLRENDTVSYFVHTMILLPPGATGADTALYRVRFENEIDYVIDLVDMTNARLVLLDSMRFIRTDSIKAWIENMWTHALSMGEGLGMDQRFIVPGPLDGMRARLRVDFRYHGPYGSRWIEREDTWIPFMDMFGDTAMTNAFQRALGLLCPHIVACDSILLSKSLQQKFLEGRIDAFDLSIHPDPGRGLYRVLAGDLPPESPATIKVFTLLGSMKLERTVVPSGEGRLNHLLDLRGIAPGVYFVLLEASGGRYAVRRIHHVSSN